MDPRRTKTRDQSRGSEVIHSSIRFSFSHRAGLVHLVNATPTDLIPADLMSINFDAAILEVDVGKPVHSFASLLFSKDKVSVLMFLSTETFW